MNILFTLCGRAGSKGVKGKNAREFLDVPLVWYSMANIALYMEKYGQGDDIKVVLNTDSEPLKDLVRKVKDVPVTIIHREENLAGFLYSLCDSSYSRYFFAVCQSSLRI